MLRRDKVLQLSLVEINVKILDYMLGDLMSGRQ
jgi:hypothetical protein